MFGCFCVRRACALIRGSPSNVSLDSRYLAANELAPVSLLAENASLFRGKRYLFDVRFRPDEFGHLLTALGTVVDHLQVIV